MPENTAAGQDVGAVLTATDVDGDTLTFTLEGADAASFDIVTTSAAAQIRTRTGVTYNHEARSTYTVIVRVDDGNGGADTVTVTITVTDVNEPPGRPAVPSVTATAGSSTSLDVTWTAPSSAGPAVASYDLRYREGARGNFTDGPQNVTALSAAIGSLASSTSYQVQVRATNAEGDGDWSFSGTGQTGAIEVPASWSLKPTALAAGDKFRLLFLSSTQRKATSAAIADYNTFVQTRAAAGHADIRTYSAGFRVVGCTFAVDARNNTSTTYTESDKGVPIYWLGGAKAADDYEDFYDGSWDDEANDKNESGADAHDTAVVWVFTGCLHHGAEAFSGGASRALGGGTGSTGVAVGVLNSSASSRGPLYAGTSTGEDNNSNSPLYGLSAVFEVSSAVVMNHPPVFSPPGVSRSVAENTAAGQDVGAAVTATDANTGDTLTYTLGGAGAASFDIVSGSGQIRTKSGVTYDHETNPSYTVTVTASDGKATADATVTITVTDVNEPPGIPAAPSVIATAGSSTSLDVSWTAPTNTGPAIASYDLQYREGASGSFTAGPQDVTGSSAAIASLMANTSHQVQVRATNAEGDGAWSFSGTGRTGNSSPAFSGATADRSVPENTAAGQDVGAVLTATDTDGDTLTYTLEGADAASFDIVTISAAAQIRTRTGVTYNHEATSTHTVIVKADDGNDGAGTVTVTITVTDVNEPPERPAAPSVAATSGSTTSLDVSWTAPTNTGPAIASYDLQYREGASGNFTAGPQDVSGLSAAIASLAPGKSHQVQVRATNAEGDGDWSFSGTGQTSATVPGAPTGLVATASGSTQIDLSWTAPGRDGGSAITGYKIEVSPDGANWTTLEADTTDSATTYSHTGLTGGATRHYRVSAINTNGAGLPSGVDDATTATTVPGVPTGLTAAARGNTQIDLTWTAPGSDGGSAITGYKIEVSPDGANWTTLEADTTDSATTYSHTGLAGGATRHYRVSAINTNGAGAPSGVDDATTGTTVPGAPTGLVATASGSTQIDLTWTAPGSDGGSAITGYKIEVSPDGANWTTHLADTTRSATTYSHTGLTGGATRHYRVSAINTNGAGAPSNVDDATTDTTAPGAPHRPCGSSQRDHPDRPHLDRPRQRRRVRHHRLQDRGLPRRRQLDHPRSRHDRQRHHLLPHRPDRRRHPPLPRLGHQHQRRRRHLGRRLRHHRQQPAGVLRPNRGPQRDREHGRGPGPRRRPDRHGPRRRHADLHPRGRRRGLLRHRHDLRRRADPHQDGHDLRPRSQAHLYRHRQGRRRQGRHRQPSR